MVYITIKDEEFGISKNIRSRVSNIRKSNQNQTFHSTGVPQWLMP